MPKMKTKSSVKGRFRVTGSGKILRNKAGKSHGMVKRSKTFIRQQRGTTVLSKADAMIVQQFMPYGR